MVYVPVADAVEVRYNMSVRFSTDSQQQERWYPFYDAGLLFEKETLGRR